MGSLKTKYQQEVRPKLAQEWRLRNPLSVPQIQKVVVSVGVGEGAENKAALEPVSRDLLAITGQKPKVTVARKAIAGFKLRKGAPIGLKVTLRRKRMYTFLEKLFKIILPRLRDFQGVSAQGFDGRGNYTLGIPEQIVFPEVDYDKIEKVRGLQITLVTNASSDEQSKRLLEELGMPFEKEKNG